MGAGASRFTLARARDLLRAGGVLAYPTEAVYGLGCDPLDAEAVGRILALKGRPAGKGLILIAADFAQLAPYLAPLDGRQLAPVHASWPGPVTWLLPVRPEAPAWLRGEHATLAVRVTAHPLAAALCRAFGGPLVSTSANRAGRPPLRSPLAVQRSLGSGIDLIIHGELGGRMSPSEIRTLDGRIVRPG